MALYCGHCGQYYNPHDSSKIIGCDCDGAKAARAEVIDKQIRKALDPKLQVRCVGRDAANAQVLVVGFDREPTDDELRHVHDLLRAGFNQTRFPLR